MFLSYFIHEGIEYGMEHKPYHDVNHQDISKECIGGHLLQFHRLGRNVSQPETKYFIARNKVCQRLKQLVLTLDTT